MQNLLTVEQLQKAAKFCALVNGTNVAFEIDYMRLEQVDTNTAEYWIDITKQCNIKWDGWDERGFPCFEL
jgi:hypothetical protein